MHALCVYPPSPHCRQYAGAFYFVHGYAVVPRSPKDVLAVTDYDGVTFVSGVESDNVAAVQFHPEKSSTLGLRFYRNFARRAGLGAGA